MKNFNTKKEMVFLYFGFLFFGMYQLIFKHQFGETAMYLGIGLAFDPFPSEIPWKNRKNWQKTILVIQATMVFICFIGEILVNQDFKIGFLEGFYGK